MSTSPLKTKTPDDIRDGILRTIKFGLQKIGIPNPNVGPNSDYYVTAQGLSDELSVAELNNISAFDQLMPDTATGADLDRLLAMYGLGRRPASQAEGYIQLVSSNATLVPTGATLTSQFGLTYTVLVGGTYSNGALIAVRSVDTGVQANLNVGSVLRWTLAPAQAQSNAAVVRAISGGVDIESDETARARLKSFFTNPPQAGNWSWVAQNCEAVDSVIQKAFPYPAANGPSTLHIALVQAPSTGSKSRAIDSLVMNNLVSTIQGFLPEYVDSVITTTTDVPVTLSFQLSLPLAASSPLAGGGPASSAGWKDSNPWPYNTSASTSFIATVCGTTSSLQFSVNAPSDPIVGITKIHWIDRVNWVVKEATVVALTHDGAGNPIVTVDVPFVDGNGNGPQFGDTLFPASVNAQNYVNAVLAAFAQMGPGEKTNIAGLLPRALRKPRPSAAWPANIDDSMLRFLTNAGSEVSSARFLYTSNTVPAIPGSINSPPNIFIPSQLAFYPPSS